VTHRLAAPPPSSPRSRAEGAATSSPPPPPAASQPRPTPSTSALRRRLANPRAPVLATDPADVEAEAAPTPPRWRRHHVLRPDLAVVHPSPSDPVPLLPHAPDPAAACGMPGRRGRIQKADTYQPTYPKLAKIIKIQILRGYILTAYRSRIRIRYVSDTRYAPSWTYRGNTGQNLAKSSKIPYYIKSLDACMEH
jgi:hypothetical protein